jgi:S-adenosylmethionine:tRNA ribosyltransferase-isomerase
VFQIKKLAPYQYQQHQLPSAQKSIHAILDHMQQQRLDKMVGETEIFIFPGYQFRICSGLITNFHMPKSTLILLIAAFVGEDWKKIYAHALKNNYRFLSYGDSSLLLK